MAEAAISAGLLLWRPGPQVLLAHPGGPFFARKDDGSWTIPKGLLEPGEEPIVAAQREFVEEIGLPLPAGLDFVPLGEVRQRNGKRVLAWAAELDLDVTQVSSNTFDLEWPPRSGRITAFPEVDRAEWFDLETARRKMVPAQAEFVVRLAALRFDGGAERGTS
jgi:predicted NUDIX family NTP pyrophosphohydrolase